MAMSRNVRLGVPKRVRKRSYSSSPSLHEGNGESDSSTNALPEQTTRQSNLVSQVPESRIDSSASNGFPTTSPGNASSQPSSITQAPAVKFTPINFPTLQQPPTATPRIARAPNTKASDWPAPTHGRPTPYNPTRQHGGRQQGGGVYAKDRGNPPLGVTSKEWSNAFNCANSILWTRTPVNERGRVTKEARKDGRTRDYAIEKLIKKGFLARGFVDANP
ncbi:hypothetical protein N431DRAFT_439728 [Stipitochalara longipes BDJ]|nr:hypothetical protein N431DRAFT_439728 [Stipitochalara longipes BDJ]